MVNIYRIYDCKKKTEETCEVNEIHKTADILWCIDLGFPRLISRTIWRTSHTSFSECFVISKNQIDFVFCSFQFHMLLYCIVLYNILNRVLSVILLNNITRFADVLSICNGHYSIVFRHIYAIS